MMHKICISVYYFVGIVHYPLLHAFYSLHRLPRLECKITGSVMNDVAVARSLLCGSGQWCRVAVRPRETTGSRSFSLFQRL